MVEMSDVTELTADEPIRPPSTPEWPALSRQLGNVLVTGASGFIGQVLCRTLQQQGVHVRALLRRPARGAWQGTILGDITDYRTLQTACSNMDTLFHLAGKAHALEERTSGTTGKDDYDRINRAATEQLVRAAAEAGVQRVVLFSSVKAMDEGSDVPIDETCVPCPETPYGCSKLAAEHAVLAAGSGIPHTSVLRLTMVYGPHAKGNLARMIQAIRHDGPSRLLRFPPLPPVPNRRSMVHVEDVIQAAILAAALPVANRRVYIVTDGHFYATHELQRAILETLGRPVPAWHVPYVLLQGAAWVGEWIGRLRGRRFPLDQAALQKLLGSACYSNARLVRELGYHPRWSLMSAMPHIVFPGAPVP